MGKLGQGLIFVLGLSVILSLVASPTAAKSKKGRADSSSGNEDGSVTGGQSITIEDFQSQITHEGVKVREIQARTGYLDEVEKILDLKDLRIRFYDAGKVKGEAQCGAGRVWMQDRPKEHISNHDMLLKDQVTYRMEEGWVIQTPQIRYTRVGEMLRSDKGYVKQMQGQGQNKNQYLIGRGQGFAIKLLPQKNTFEWWEEYGNPAVLEKTKEPVLKP